MNSTNAKQAEAFSELDLVCSKQDSIQLSTAVFEAVDQYFRHMDGHDCNDLYTLVMQEVEKPLLKCVLQNCAGNQSRASEILGISRGNLRNKLRKYEML